MTLKPFCHTVQIMKKNKQIKSFADIINSWPSVPVMAKELGVTCDKIYKWRKRNKIQSYVWTVLYEKARVRKIKINYKTLAEMAAKTAANE